MIESQKQELLNFPVMVTIGIPNYNYAHYIIAALNSVIAQTYQNLELIIVDDVSTDDSIEIIERWINEYKGSVKINFIKNSVNQGLAKVCNQILANAHGKYFQTLDADDIILPGKIEQQVNAMELSKNAAFIYSNIGVIDEKGNLVSDDYLERIGYDKSNMPHGNIFEKLFDFNFIPLPSVLVNTEFTRTVGGFDETLQVQDYYLWLKLAENYQTIYLPGNTALYREHNKSMSRNSLTNPRSVDSVLSIKFDYYKNSNKNIQNKIRKNMAPYAVYLYQFNYPTAKKWLSKNFMLNPGLKSFIYYASIQLGISHSLFSSIKSKVRSFNHE
jgi:glycosyltransferase involved in cell wall biosynthesis